MEILLITISEILLISFIIVVLYNQRNRFGLFLLFIFIGSNQYLQTIISATIYLKIFDDYLFSPGSVVLFSSSIFTILLVYIKEGVHKTRTLIYGILLTNITLTIFSAITSVQLNMAGSINLLTIPKEIFNVNVKMFLIGTFLLILDSAFIIIIYEFILIKLSKINIFWTLIISMFTVLYLDSIIFSLFTFQSNELFINIFIGNIIGKSISGFIFTLVLYVYIVYIDKSKYLEKLKINKNAKDIFSIISYRERFELLQEEKTQVEELKNNLSESNKNKDKFFSIVSHDLRSPVGSIVGFLKFMDENFNSFNNEQLRKNIKMLYDSSKKAFDLLTNILDWSRIQMDKIQVNPVSFSINEIVNESINLLIDSANKKQIVISFNCIKNYNVYADKDMIRSVIRNLLTNAIKFTNIGKEININIESDSNEVIISVQDNGVGIDKEIAEKLFEAKSTITTRGTDNEIGTGLGLNLSAEFVRRNYGKIWLESKIAKGSTFTFTLPSYKVD